MAQELKLGLKASAEQFDPRELVEIAVAAEEHGMDSVAVSDHFQPWRHNGGHAPFSLAWMAAVGERTKRVQIGTSVMTPTFRYNPAVIAQAFASMGCMYRAASCSAWAPVRRSTSTRRVSRGSGRSSRNASLDCARPSP